VRGIGGLGTRLPSIFPAPRFPYSTDEVECHLTRWNGLSEKGES